MRHTPGNCRHMLRPPGSKRRGSGVRGCGWACACVNLVLCCSVVYCVTGRSCYAATRCTVSPCVLLRSRVSSAALQRFIFHALLPRRLHTSTRNVLWPRALPVGEFGTQRPDADVTMPATEEGSSARSRSKQSEQGGCGKCGGLNGKKREWNARKLDTCELLCDKCYKYHLEGSCEDSKLAFVPATGRRRASAAPAPVQEMQTTSSKTAVVKQ